MNILICDDIKDEAQKLKKAVKETGLETSIMIFNKGQDVLEYIKTNIKIDVCFLDIIMPEMNGIELAQKIIETGFGGKIIFLSSSNEYGFESYQVKAFSYLLKPVSQKEVENILRKILELKKNEDNAGFPVATKNLKKFLYFYEISYIEVMRNRVYFHLLNREEIIIIAALNEVLPQLDSRFAQCHRSFIINMDAVSQIQGKEILLRCGRKVTISRSYKDFSNLYLKHIFTGDKNG